MIGQIRNAEGYRKGVLIDYNYVLNLAKKCIVSPVAPDVWPRSIRRKKGDTHFYRSLRELGAKEKKLQKRILECLDAGIRICGHRTVRLK